MSTGVVETSVRPDSAIYRHLHGADFFDAFIAPMPASITALEFYLLQVAMTPGWIRWLMALRNRAVRLVGLKDLGGLHEFDPTRPAAAYRVGDRLGIFSVVALSDDEVILGDSDKHLDVKVSFRRVQGVQGAQAVATTVVHIHNRLGRLYMFLVRPFHKRIVPAMLARAGEKMP